MINEYLKSEPRYIFHEVTLTHQAQAYIPTCFQNSL